MLQGLVNKAFDVKLRSVKFENRLLRDTEGVTSSPRPIKRMVEAMLDKQDFIAPAATIVKKETERAVDVESRREDRCRKFIKAAYK